MTWAHPPKHSALWRSRYLLQVEGPLICLSLPFDPKGSTEAFRFSRHISVFPKSPPWLVQQSLHPPPRERAPPRSVSPERRRRNDLGNKGFLQRKHPGYSCSNCKAWSQKQLSFLSTTRATFFFQILRKSEYSRISEKCTGFDIATCSILFEVL